MAPLSESLSAFIEDIRVRWGVPGLSVSFVDGRSQGFGHPTSGPMTPDTVTSIASNTKLLTAVAIGILVDQGKLSLDSKIRDLIPGFDLDNKYTAEHVTVADTLSHSTGCASGNMIYAYLYNDHHKDILDNICATRCHKELRQTFEYDNRWFSVAAYIIEQLSGQTYSEFIQKHILRPLSMDRSTFSSKEAEANTATPTITLDDRKSIQDLPFWFARAEPGNAWEGPAGLFSTSSDMAKWLNYLMRAVKGEKADDNPMIISAQTLKEVIKPRVVSDMQMCFTGFERGESAHPEFSTPTYGLGVERYQLYGIDVAAHNGSMFGYGSFTLWTPSRDFGVAITANQMHRGNVVIDLIALRAFEEHFGIQHADWEARTMEKQEMWGTGPGKLPKTTLKGNEPVFTASQIQGTYEAKGYKNLHIVDMKDAEGVPARILELRDRFLQPKMFGRLAGETTLMAFWDTTDSYGDDYARLYHVGGNIFYGELVKVYDAGRTFDAVAAPRSAVGSFSGPLFYAYEDSKGILHLEFQNSWTETAPDTALGGGDFTLTRVEAF